VIAEVNLGSNIATNVVDQHTDKDGKSVRYVVADPRIAASYDEPPVWTTGVVEYAIAVDEVEAGMKDRLAAPDTPAVEKLRYMTALSGMALAREDPQTAQDLSLGALQLAQKTGDPAEVTMAWYSLGNTLYQSAVFVGAEQAYTECVDRALDEKNDPMVAQAMAGLGHSFYMREQFEAAIDCYETSAKLFEKLAVPHGQAYAMTWAGEANAHMRRHALAAEAFDRALGALDRVDPALAREYSGQRAEVLMRKANLFGKAGLTQQQRECAAQARRLGAIDHLADHP
jgi:tetratricopeptide (TPR) repeat protein